MSLVTRVTSDAYSTIMSYDGAFSGINGNIAQMALTNGAGSIDSKALTDAEKRIAHQKLKDNLTQKIADEMLKNKKREKLSGFDTFS